MHTRYMLALLPVIAIACGERPGTQPPAGEPMAQSAMPAVRDTIRVVVQETLRTVYQDTVHTLVMDTIRTVVADTVRTIIIASQDHDAAGGPTSAQSPAPEYQRQIETAQAELSNGTLSVPSLSLLTRGLPEFQTVAGASLDSAQVLLYAQLAGVQPDRITRVRWGKSMAPAGHPHADGSFLSVWTEEDAPSVVRIDSTGLLQSHK